MKHIRRLAIFTSVIFLLVSKGVQVGAQGPSFYGIDLSHDITYYGTQPSFHSVTCGLYVIQSWIEYDQIKRLNYSHPSPYWHTVDWWLSNVWDHWELHDIGGRSDETPLTYNAAYPNASLWKMNVAYDFGGDPLAMSWIMFLYGPGWYNDFVYETSFMGTKGVAASVAKYNEPAAVAVYNGTHFVLFKGVESYSDPSQDPQAVIEKVHYYDSLYWYWGPENYNQPEQAVLLNTWQNNVWGTSGYNYNLETGGGDPDPWVGGYRSYTHPHGDRIAGRYLWTGKYVTVQWEDLNWVDAQLKPDWAYKGHQFQGQIIPWFDYSIHIPMVLSDSS